VAAQWDGAEFSAFDLPLGMMRGEKFEQPIFGCNHLKGEIAPLPPVGTISDPPFTPAAQTSTAAYVQARSLVHSSSLRRMLHVELHVGRCR
jgi:hypothetical protein